MRQHADQRAQPREARVVVRLAEVDGAADRRVHLRAAQIFVADVLADRALTSAGPAR